MIEVQILIAAALVGMLFVLVRISWTLKGILDALSAGRGVSAAPEVPAGKTIAEKAEQGLENAPADTSPAIDAPQDIAAVIAVAERTIRQGKSSKPTRT